MSVPDMIFLVFWVLQIFKLIGMFSRFFSKREFLSLCVITSTLGTFGTFAYELAQGPDWEFPFIIIWAWILRRDYREWQKHKDDDDDDHRHKRWSRAKSWLPKPETKTIAQPI